MFKNTLLSSTALRYMGTSEGQLQAHQHLRAAKRAIRFYKFRGSNFEWDLWDKGAIAFHTTLVVKKSPNHKDIGALFKPGRSMRAQERRLRNTLMLAAFSISYGSGHLVAWNAGFATPLCLLHLASCMEVDISLPETSSFPP
jgi:hypothetical protein